MSPKHRFDVCLYAGVRVSQMSLCLTFLALLAGSQWRVSRGGRHAVEDLLERVWRHLEAVDLPQLLQAGVCSLHLHLRFPTRLACRPQLRAGPLHLLAQLLAPATSSQHKVK